MSQLFAPFSIKGMRLANRLVRSATFDSLAQADGEVTEAQIELYRELAKGGAGLLVVGFICAHQSGRASQRQLCLDRDEHIPGLARLCQAVHGHGGKVAAQMVHSGREGARYRALVGGEPAWAPSQLDDDPLYAHPHRAMTSEEIEEVVAAFGAAARRAREAGFDAVQVHGAHAYLLSQFLSPHTNRRKDQWGWELGGRLHLHLATLAAIREQVGPDYPVMIKLGVADAIEGGLPLKDGLEAARRLAQAGYDCLEISQGLRGEGYSNAEFRPEDRHAGQEGYFCDWAGAVKQRVSVPVIAVGGLRTPQACAQVLERNQADLVALCRPLISEPDLPARWQAGDQSRSRCISCNKCLEGIMSGQPLGCILAKEPAAQ